MFPVALDLTVLKSAVAGGSDVAARRLRLLDEAGAADVRVFAPDPCEAMAARAGGRLERRLPEAGDLAALDVLFIADLGSETETRLAEAARAAKVLVNTEDVRPLCDFHVPAMVRRGDLLLAVSTGGASPGLARRLKKYLEGRFGDEWAGHIDEISAARARWRDEGLPLPELARRTDALIDEKGWLT